MKRFVEGEDRRQGTLLPECLEDYVSEENPVRVIDVFVDELDLQGLGFEGVTPEATGRPGYHPGLLLKMYVYGYINQITSSRKLEREAQRNVEMMWLTGRLAPDFKTIADFRKDNGPAIRAGCRRFIALCRKLDLFSHAVAAIDGSKFKAVNTRDKNFTRASIQRRMEQVEASIERYMAALETADRLEGEIARTKSVRLKEKIAALREQMRDFQALEVQVHAAPDQQISLTDPDARAMATNGKGTGMVGYNVQTAVDAKHHLIVAHEVTNVGNDRSQLANMGALAKAEMGVESLDVLADRGYFSGEEVLACETLGVIPYVPRPLTSGAKADGRFGKQDFVYIPEQNVYRCPSGQVLPHHMTTVEKGLTLHRYWDRASCQACPLKARCTPSKERRVTRWEHEAVIEAMQDRLERAPKAMRIRRATVEHPFGTLKAWMGATHFRMRRLENVRTEMSLHVLAYNLKRVIAIIGMQPLMEAMRA
ncbi:IS1182 family transposase [Phenylobacterium sp.]|uniref:IS1182 family transposase n=1 Tax=Phenylobacterium sp. TaxID=1871053 RepID=UPI0030F3F658